MEDRTDYGKLAWLKTGDLAARIAKLEGRKEKEAEKYRTVHGNCSLNAPLIYLTEARLFDIEAGNPGNAAFFFKLRFDNPLAAGNCYIYFYAGDSLIGGGLTDIGAGRQEAVFAGSCELQAGAYAVRVRIEGFTGRTLLSANYTVSGCGLAIGAPDNFLSVCADESNTMYACCCLPDGVCRLTKNSGASWSTLPLSGVLGKTSLTLTERGGFKYALRLIAVQSGALYALEETYAGRVIEESGVAAACAYQMKGCDDVFNIIYIKNFKAFCVEAGASYFCKPAPVWPSMKFKECRAVAQAPSPMFILTDINGESFLIEAENIRNGPLTVRTVSASAEAV